MRQPRDGFKIAIAQLTHISWIAPPAAKAEDYMPSVRAPAQGLGVLPGEGVLSG